MCGTIFYIQVGDFTWRILPSNNSILMGKIITYSVSSTAMEVHFTLIRGGEVAVFVKNHFADELRKNENYLKKNY